MNLILEPKRLTRPHNPACFYWLLCGVLFMIHKTGNGRYVASSDNVWIPGVFEDERTANYAFRFTNEQLQKLQEEKNKTNDCIKFKNLQELKRKNNAT